VNVPQLKQTFPGFPFLEGKGAPTTLNGD